MKTERIQVVVYAVVKYENDAARTMALREVRENLGMAVYSSGDPGCYSVTTGRVVVKPKEQSHG